MFTTKIQKWGDGQGLKLSKQVLDLAGIAVGDDVEIVVLTRQIIVTKAESPTPTLAELVAKIPPAMRVGEVDFGPPVGREEW